MNIEIDIILDGKQFALRLWPAVPRIGEAIYLKRGTIRARVVECVWGSNSDSEEIGGQLRVSLVCETITL